MTTSLAVNAQTDDVDDIHALLAEFVKLRDDVKRDARASPAAPK